MYRLIIILLFLVLTNYSYSQKEKKILDKALSKFNEIELPKLEREALIKLKNNIDTIIFNKEASKYHFIIIPTYKKKESIVKYNIGDKKPLAQYIDFSIIQNDYEAYVFKDTILIGFEVNKFNINWHYFSSNKADENYYDIGFKSQNNLARKIKQFNPDIAFRLENCAGLMFFIKNGKLFIGKISDQDIILDLVSILPVEDFIKKDPSAIEELQRYRHPKKKDYIEIK
jgi:hypothetical protein